METDFNTMFRVVELVAILIIAVCAILFKSRNRWRQKNMEKKVTDYFTDEGYEWKKEDGVLNVKRAGANFRIFLRAEEELASTSLWVQYATKLDEDLKNMPWAGQTIMVNVLNDRHPSLNVSMNIEEHVLWVHYRADIHSKKEIAFHFNGAYNEIQSLMKDYSEILPKLQVDFPLQKKQQNTIGFHTQ